MAKAKNGDTVKVHYTGKLEDGRTFATTKEDAPVQVEIGSGRHIKGFEKGIIGMEIGETKTIVVPPEGAYGPKREELAVDVKKSDLPHDITPGIGQQLQARQKDGSVINVIVTHVDEDTVTLDANHPLAGRTLTFDIQLVEAA
jgi:peptidylprolyl isomerase